jgi:uncharacterized protein YdaU (DUF1376 family)
MKKPAFQFYPGDYLSSSRVAMMTLEEEGAYLRLLCYCWAHGSIPADPEKIARLIGKGASTTLATTLQPMFKQDPSDPLQLRHERLDAERDKQAEWAEKSSRGGKMSAEARKTAKRCNDGLTTLQPPFNHPANQRATLQSSSSSTSSYNDPLEAAAQSETPGGKDRAEKSAPASKRKQRPNPETDAEWLTSLSKDAAYQGIDVGREHAKMARWCATNRQQPTRRRFINWLNRIEKPLNGPHSGTDPEIARKLAYEEGM